MTTLDYETVMWRSTTSGRCWPAMKGNDLAVLLFLETALETALS